MSKAQSDAQKQRWERDRQARAEAAGAQADAIAEAIQNEVVEEVAQSSADSGPAPKADHSARLAMLDEVRKARESEENEEPTHEAEPPAEAEPAAEAEVSPQPEAAAAPEVVRVKVDGEEFDVPKTDVDAHGGVAAYQINRAAEKRLAKAKEIEQQTSATMLKLQQMLQPVPAPQRSVDELIKEKISQVQFGSPDEAAQAIKDIMSASQPQAIDPAKLRQEAVDEVFRRMAAEQFVQRNVDILGSRTFAQLAILAETDMLREQGKPSDWNKFYASLEGNLRMQLGKPTIAATSMQQTAQPTSGSVADKEARKASIVALPVASARAALPEEPKPKSREQVLADLRRSRGQPV